MQLHRGFSKDWLHCLTPVSLESDATSLSEGMSILMFCICLQEIRFCLELEPELQECQELWPLINLVFYGKK